ncbi:MAG: class I SAM-dependent methyltransferase [Patescibacteria group bacterium]
MENTKFKKILEQVPLDYYQSTVRHNLLQRYWHTTKVNFALKLLKKIPLKNCLDVGSASGHMISQIAKKYPKAQFFAVDAYKEAIEYGRKNYPHVTFIYAEAEKLTFKNNQFDLCLCYETIEHTRNPKKALSEMKRVLKPNGTLILAMDSGNLAFRIIWFFWEKTYAKAWQGAHLHPFHHKDLRKLLLKAGFKIQKQYFTHFGLEVVYILTK